MTVKSKTLLAVMFGLALGLLNKSLHAADLPNVEDKVTVSGLSSGAFMAQQFHYAYSGLVKGMGAIAGGAYRCYEPSAAWSWLPAQAGRGLSAIDSCLNFNIKTISKNYEDVLKYAEEGLIDPSSNLKGDRVFMFNSKSDEKVDISQGKKSKELYEKFISNEAQIKFVDVLKTSAGDFNVAHGIPTKNTFFDQFNPKNTQTRGCSLGSNVGVYDPFLYDCEGYPEDETSLTYQMLSHLYDGLKAPSRFNPDQFFQISQVDYVDGFTTKEELITHSLGEFAYAYVPEKCQDSETSCKLHVAFHGCKQYPTFKMSNGKIFGDTFYRNVYNTLAEANDMVVLYPQTHDSGNNSINKNNPEGCWDFWGQYKDQWDTYFTKDARQMKMVFNMIEAIQTKSIKWEKLN